MERLRERILECGWTVAGFAREVLREMPCVVYAVLNGKRQMSVAMLEKMWEALELTEAEVAELQVYVKKPDKKSKK